MPKGPNAIEIVWRNVWVRALAYVFGTIFIGYALWNLRSGYAFAFQVAVIGFVLAYILNPLVELFERLRIGRALAVLLVYILLFLLLLLGSLLITQVVAETGRFVALIPEAIDNIIPFIERIASWFAGLQENLPGFLAERFGGENGTPSDTVGQLEETITAFLAQAAQGVNEALQALISNTGTYLLPAGESLLAGVTTIFSTTFQIFLIVLASGYFLYDFPKFTANFRRYVPLRYRPFYNDIIYKADGAVGGYLRGQLLITIIVGLLIWLGLTLIGVPLALAISFLAAIFNLVPYLGPIVGSVPAILLAFTVSPWSPLFVVLVFVAANQVEANVLSPLILSRATNLHPVTVLLAILAGFGLFGLVGGLLAIPTVALIKVVLEEYLLTRPAYLGLPGTPVVAEPTEEDEKNPLLQKRKTKAKSQRPNKGDTPDK